MSFETPLWRALAVFRALALGYVVVLYAGSFSEYARPTPGWVVIAVLATWTILTAWAYAAPRRRRWPLLAADLLIGCASVLLTRVVDTTARIEAGEATLPTIWSVAPVFAWATWAGWRGGLFSAVMLAIADWVERGTMTGSTLHNIVLVLLGGLVVGYLVDRARQGQVALEQALALEAATRERERLARSIHDGVLQVLALVQRRGAEIGGPAAELGRLAGEQEASLRAGPLVAGPVAAWDGNPGHGYRPAEPVDAARIGAGDRGGARHAGAAARGRREGDGGGGRRGAGQCRPARRSRRPGMGPARAGAGARWEGSGPGHGAGRRPWTAAAAPGPSRRGGSARRRPIDAGPAARSRRRGDRHVHARRGHRG